MFNVSKRVIPVFSLVAITVGIKPCVEKPRTRQPAAIKYDHREFHCSKFLVDLKSIGISVWVWHNCSVSTTRENGVYANDARSEVALRVKANNIKIILQGFNYAIVSCGIFGA